jgi:hypothetical protein
VWKQPVTGEHVDELVSAYNRHRWKMRGTEKDVADIKDIMFRNYSSTGAHTRI